jgi:hypothetical protein
MIGGFVNPRLRCRSAFSLRNEGLSENRPLFKRVACNPAPTIRTKKWQEFWPGDRVRPENSAGRAGVPEWVSNGRNSVQTQTRAVRQGPYSPAHFTAAAHYLAGIRDRL